MSKIGETRQFLDKYISAVRSKDVEGLIGLYGDDVRVYDLWVPWVYEGKQAWRESVMCWFSSLGDEVVHVSLENLKIVETSECSIICAFAKDEARSPQDKAIRSMQNRVTWALVRCKGEWRVAHEHTSAPVSHETLKATLTRQSATGS